MPTERRGTARLVLGVLVMALGVLLTLDNLGLFQARQIVRYWPALLIAVGLAKVYERWGRGWRGEGTLWILIGTWLLLEKLGVHVIHDLWPVLLILIGARIAWRGARPRSLACDVADSHSDVEGIAVMSGIRRSNNSPDFRRGNLVAVMGGCEVDLRQAKIAGEQAVIDVFAFWGGIEIRVPPEWSVTSQVTPLMGGFEDSTQPPKEGGGPRLLITGSAVMGGVEVKN